MPRLPEIFYDRYYHWDDMLAFVNAARQEFPELVTLRELGRTPEDRPLLCVQVTGPGADPESKPAYLVQANVHAPEVAGTTASLHLLWHLLNGADSDPDVGRLLRDITFYVVPRMNPDGAEYILTTGGPIRSRNFPRYRKNGLYPADVDGNGLILSMRLEDPRGNMKPHPQDPRFMVPRDADDAEGPFYFVHDEGLVHDWDGGPLVPAIRSTDFNRNWAANWKPEHEQHGAGDFPFSQPEMHALAEFIYAHPNIFGILGFHCGSNSMLRPPSTGTDDDILPADLDKMKEIGLRGEELTGFKLRAVIEYKPDDRKPASLQGHFHDWGYRHLGLHVFEIELGNISNSCGISSEQFFAASDKERRDFGLASLKWHDQHRDKGAFTEWTPFDHPQLGAVEIGGWQRQFLANPASEDMQEIAPRCSLFAVDHARRHPCIELIRVEATPVEGNIHRLCATVINTGDLPTQVTELGHRVTHNDPVRVRLEGVEVLSRGAVQEIGHLGPVSGYRDLEWFVRAQPGSTALITATSQKGGTAQAQVVF